MKSASSNTHVTEAANAARNASGENLFVPCAPSALPPELLALSFGLIPSLSLSVSLPLSMDKAPAFLWPIEAAKRPARDADEEEDDDEEEDEADDEVADDDEEDDDDEEEDEEDDEDEEEEEDEFEESESGFDDDDDDDEDEDDFDDE